MLYPRMMNLCRWLAVVGLANLPSALSAQTVTYSQVVSADTFLSSGEPDRNFGSMGAMEIAAPTAGQPRTEVSLFRFETAALQAAFDADYGGGNWVVSGVSLTLFSSVATAGQQPNNISFNKIAAGDFELSLLSNDNWSETEITWNRLPEILPGGGSGNTATALGTFSWLASGTPSSTWILDNSNLLLTEIYQGSTVTILGQPTADSPIGYLINTLKGSAGLLNVTATSVPEPTAPALMACVAGLASRRIFHRASSCKGKPHECGKV